MDKNIPKGGGRLRRQIAALLFSVALSPLATSAVIDSFDTSQPGLSDTTADGNALVGSVGSGADPTILGGARDISVSLLSGYQAKVDFPPSVFSMSVTARSVGTATVQWDGPDNSIALDLNGLGGVDLTENGFMDALSITTLYADHPYEFTVGIYSDSNRWTEVTYSRSATFAAVTETYPFTDFTDPALCGTTNPAPGISRVVCGAQPADLTSVGAMQLIADPDGKASELDWAIDIIETVSTSNCTGLIGDYVWNDANRNGIQDAGEEGLNGVEVSVTDANGRVRTVTTVTGGPQNQPGYYAVPGLCAGTYTVAVNTATVPAGMVPTLIREGSDPAVDSDDPAGTTVTLPADDSQDITIDFGFETPCSGSIGDYVWNDANRNGIQEANEEGLNGVEVLVTDAAGNVRTVTSFTGGPQNQPGYYVVEGLCAGTYNVAVNLATVPAGMDPTLINQGGDPAADSDDPAGTSVTLPADDSQDATVDFGFQAPCSGAIGDYVWNDANRNGIQDAGEEGINGVVVNVVGSNGMSRTVTTFTGGPQNQPGYYVVEGLCAGDYGVSVDPATVPAGMQPTLLNQGNDPAADSDDPAGTPVTLPADDSQDMTIDFGYQTPCSGLIGDYVWNDANRNGIQEANEEGLNGVEVLVTDSLGNVRTATTFTGGPQNQPGYYAVEGLCADTYTVAVNLATVPAGMDPTLINQGGDPAADSDDPAGTTVTLPADDSQDATVDFGFQTPCSGAIGDYVWNDANRNGIQETGEEGINGVEVLVTDSLGNVRTATTFTGGPQNQPGYYVVEGLCADTYNVAVNSATVPAGMEPTLLHQGNDGSVDSNDPAGTSVTLPADDSQDMTIDFGYQTPCSGLIGDYVWNDANRNGIQEANEEGLNGVEVLVTDSNGNVRTVTTFTGGPQNQPGYYAVEGLCAGTYSVAVNLGTVPAGMEPTLLYQGNDRSMDSDNPAGTSVTLPADDSQNATVDFGFQTPCSGAIGDYVWNDANRNGIQDAGEEGLNGVEVLVTDGNGNVRTVTTFTGGPMNQPGYYVVEGLCAGTYSVAVNSATVPAGMEPTLLYQGNDRSMDSDNPAGTSVTLPADDSRDMTIDFGYQTPCSGAIGDYVWNDANRNGLQEAGEEGLNGVEVLVTDSNGNVRTVTTFTGGPMNQPGYYVVEGLCAGTYSVAVNSATVPAGMQPTLLYQGNDTAADSNDPAGTSVTLPADDSRDMTIDFGYQIPCTGAIGDYVWDDANHNGIQDAGEYGINGVEVLVTDSNGNVRTITTFTGGPQNQPGYYLVDGLCAGSYSVAVNSATVPMDMMPTLIGQGNDAALDSNDPAGTTVNLPADDSQELTIDFGYYYPMAGCQLEVVKQCLVIYGPPPGGGCDSDKDHDGCGGCGGCSGCDSDKDDDSCGNGCGGSHHGGGRHGGGCGSSGSCDSDKDDDSCGSGCGGSHHGGGRHGGGCGSSGSCDSDKDDDSCGSCSSDCDGSSHHRGGRHGGHGGSCGGSSGCDSDKDHDGCGGCGGHGSRGAYVQYSYLVKNVGATDISGITVEDDVLGTVEGSPVPVLGVGESIELLDMMFIDQTTVNTVTVSGNGGACVATDTATVEVVEGYPPGHGDDGDKDSDKDHDGCGGSSGCGSSSSHHRGGRGGRHGGRGGHHGGCSHGCGDSDKDSDKDHDGGYQPPQEPSDYCIIYVGYPDDGDKDSDKDDDSCGSGCGGGHHGGGHHGGGCGGSGGCDSDKDDDSCGSGCGGGHHGGGHHGGGCGSSSSCGGSGGDDSASCSACDGKVTQMTLRYEGDWGGYVQVVQGSVRQGRRGRGGHRRSATVVYEGWVEPGETFSFSGADRWGTLGTEISIYVDGYENARIHTSCSRPVGPGLTAGDFTVVEAESRNGGRICPL